MIVRTLLVGYTPTADTSSLKATKFRNENYFRDFLAQYDLDELHFVSFQNYKEKLVEINPFIVITTGEYYASEISSIKSDVFIYVVYDAGSIFHRKSEREQKESDNKKKFEEIESLIKRLRDVKDEKEEASIRKVAGMNYKDKYEMIQRAIIGEDKELAKKAWEVLNSNEVHKDYLWMRVNLVVDCWRHASAEQKAELLIITMKDYIDSDMARQLPDFSDEDSNIYKQYMFVYPNGLDANYIRRIPVPKPGMDKYTFESLLEKFEIPNGPRMMLELGQAKKARNEWRKTEAGKISEMLGRWEKNPKLTKRELNVAPTHPNYLDEPLLGFEVELFRDALRRYGRVE